MFVVSMLVNFDMTVRIGRMNREECECVSVSLGIVWTVGLAT